MITLFILSVWLPPTIFLCHWVGDYWYQVPVKGMAANKKIYINVCLKHCTIYTICHLPLILLIGICMNTNIWLLLLAWVAIGILHFLQDWYEWPTKKLMETARQSEEWYKALYIPIDNGYHIISNYIIFALLITYSFLGDMK